MNKFNLGKVRGEDGKSATIAIGTVRTGQAGSNASVENVGDSLRAILDFTIPRGDKGEKGDRGNEAYSAGSNVQISGGVISAKDTTYAPATPSADGLMSKEDKVKLNGIATGATKNATDAQLRDRATHTGTQAISTVSGLQAALDSKVDDDDPRLTDAREWSAATVPQAEAEAGTASTRRAWTAQRVRQAINAWFNGVSGALGRTILTRTTAAQVRSDIGLGTAATSDVVQEAGDSQTDVMTQKAVTDAINSATSAAPVVVATNATVTLTSNQAVYAVNTSSAPVTLTLPASPIAGARVTIIDYANTFQTNACTVARNGKNIEGAASNLSLHLRGQSVTLLFIDNTVGWKIIAQSKQGGFA